MPFQFGPYTVEDDAVSCGAWALARATDATGQPVRLSFLRLPDDLPETQRAETIAAMDRCVARWTASGAAAGLAGVVEGGQMEGGLYLVENAVGTTLRDAVAAAPLPLSDTVSLLQAVAQGLEGVHSAGALHPWLSPDNVVYAGAAPVVAGQTWSEVFAVLRAAQPAPAWPDSAFTAPEVLNGASPDARSEAWGVAAMAAYALTGEDPARLSENSALSTAVYAALRRGLSSDPAARQSCARELVVDLTVERAIAVDDQAAQNAVPTGGEVPDWARELLVETTARREAGRPLVDAPEPTPPPAAPDPAPVRGSAPTRASAPTPAPARAPASSAAAARPSRRAPQPPPDPVPAAPLPEPPPAAVTVPADRVPDPRAPAFDWSSTSHVQRSWVPIVAVVLSVLFVLLGLAVTVIRH